MTRFILVRHGETDWNLDERFRGRADLHLNPSGVKQAEAAALSLKHYDVAAIYTSPLKRSAETAGILSGQLHVPVEIMEGLIDIDFGKWQGLSTKEAAEQDSELYSRWVSSPHKVRFPDGEGLEDVRGRVMAVIDEAAARHFNHTVVLVSHKVVCHVLLCAILGLDNSHFWQVTQDVCAINVFDLRNGSTTVISINDTCHLKTLAAE